MQHSNASATSKVVDEVVDHTPSDGIYAFSAHVDESMLTTRAPVGQPLPHRSSMKVMLCFPHIIFAFLNKNKNYVHFTVAMYG